MILSRGERSPGRSEQGNEIFFSALTYGNCLDKDKPSGEGRLKAQGNEEEDKVTLATFVLREHQSC